VNSSLSKSEISLIRKYWRVATGNEAIAPLRGPTTYAYEQPKLVERLKVDGAESPKTYLLADKHFHRTVAKFEATSAAAPYSPHRPLGDSPYYVKTRTLDELDILIPDEDAPALTHVVHVGPKGSGKTTVQNQWLHTRHSQLEDKKVLYVRCDAPRIFDLFSRESASITTWDASLLPTLEEYLDLQMIYILAKYYQTGLPGRIFKALESEEATFKYKQVRSVDSPLRIQKPISWFLKDHVYLHIKNFEVDSSDRERSYLQDVLFRDKKTKRREYFQWQECAAELKKWLKANGYTLLRIVDGIDNLHLNTEAGQRTYNAFLPEVRQFVLRAAPAYEIRFAVMRHRTWMDILKNDPATQGAGSVVFPECINHVTPEPHDVARSRLKWLNLETSNTDAQLIIEAAAFALPEVQTLHENIRNFIVSTTTLAIQVKFRSHQLGGDVDYRKQAHQQMKRNLFLNGRFFLSTERGWPILNREKGLAFINPFWLPDCRGDKGS
jgi:hypothetical protein